MERFVLFVVICCVALKAGGQPQLRYDGTPVDDNLLVIDPGQQQQDQGQPLIIIEPRPQAQPQDPPVYPSRQRPAVQPQQPLFVLPPRPPVQPQPVFVTPQRPAVQPQPQPVFVSQPRPPVKVEGQQLFLDQGVMSQMPQVQSTCPTTPSLVHASMQGRSYHFSWCSQSQPGQQYFHAAAQEYCRSLPPLVVGNRRYNFDLMQITAGTDFDLLHALLLRHGIPFVWTRDTAATVDYGLRQLITEFGNLEPSMDCLSLDAFPSAFYIIGGNCSVPKAAICVTE